MIRKTLEHLATSVDDGVLAGSHLMYGILIQMKMKDNNKEKRLMRRRGRPRKSETENSVVRKPRALRLSDEEERYIAGNAERCRMNFSEYCRRVLMDYKPGVPDTMFRDELFAARKDIVNFINNIKGLKMGSEERKEFLRSMPVIQQWWKRLFPMIEFLDKKIERGVSDDSKSKSRGARQRLYDVCHTEKGCGVRLL